MRVSITGFSLGIFWLQQQAELPGLTYAAAVALAVWLFAALSRLRAASGILRWVAPMLAFLATLVVGAAWAEWRASLRLAEALPTAWESVDIDVQGVVASLPVPTEYGVRFEFDVEQSGEAPVPRRVSLAWYSELDRKRGESHPPPELRPGDRWHLTVRLRRPHGTQNPQGFDFEAWALERGIRATGYVRPKGVNVKQATASSAPGYAIDRLRLAIRERMLAALDASAGGGSEAPYRGVLVALVIGEQGAIPAEQWRVFWRTGTGHLVSISGLHVTMVAGLIYWLVFRCWARMPSLALRLPAQRAAALAGALAALGYALVAGFSVPAQRTFFMLAAIAAALWIGRGFSASRVLALALLAVLLYDPWAVLSPGFWLSFGAVAMIFYVTALRTGRPGTLSSAARTQLAVTVGLLPLTLALFQEVSLISPLANAFAIPLVSLVVVPIALLGALAGFIASGDWLLWCAHAAMHAGYLALAALAEMPHAVWQSHAPPWWAAALAMIGAPWLLAPRGIPLRMGGLVLMLPLFLVLPAGPAPGELVVDLLDVGQGLSAVVRTASHSLVYDTGPRWNSDADSGSRIVVPFLRGEGIRDLDLLVVSHDDDDHTGGARSVIAARRPAAVLTSLAPQREALAGAEAVHRCERGRRWRWDGVDFEILHPAADAYERTEKTNDMSCALKISSSGGSIFITGDIEKKSEFALLAREREASDALKADVLVVPHHGSRTSSTEAFLQAVAPSIALIPVGYRSRFHHPHPAVVARYAARGIALYRTDLSGAIRVHFQANRSPDVRSWRETQPRYWRERPRPESEASAIP